MADAEEPQFNTLAERIAALNKQKNFASTSEKGVEPARKRPPPPPPPSRPASETRTQANADTSSGQAPTQATPAVPLRPVKPQGPPPLPRRDTQTSLGSQSDNAKAAPPPLPSRTSSAQSVPAIAPRHPSLQLMPPNGRRGSASSEVSLRSTLSTSSTGYPLSSATSNDSTRTNRKLPPSFDPAKLPPLPPTRRELEAKAEQPGNQEAARPKDRLVSTQSAPVVRQTQTASVPNPKPSLPPRLPSRPAKPAPTPSQPTNGASTQQPAHSHTPPPTQPRKLPPRAPQQTQQQPPQQPPRQPPRQSWKQSQPQADQTEPPTEPATEDEAPPPIPLASRPTFAQIDATSARIAAQADRRVQCWVCHDWSGPDGVAAQFPRQNLPRNDPVGHLARGLCDPFPSLTDKARAIFTWFHHNIWYDTVAFFGNNVKHMSVEDTIFSGKAVCQGYAETYKAIAKRAGLECEVVGGHGKGYGHTALKKGERPPPPKPDGHAWNAVRIDGGEWKLLDACWGAGHLDCSTNEYKQKFSPGEFTKSNDKFGLTHFPRNTKHQYRNDGRIMTWDEYFIGRVNGETPTFYTNAHQEGIAEDSLQPAEKHIPVNSGQVVRFQFSKICEHWRPETHGLGKPPLLLLGIHGLDGRKDEMRPMETDGYWHWLDVDARELGAPGQSVQVSMLTSMDGRDGRGVTARDFSSKRGKVSMAWAGVIQWQLV
ncbi:hypothetical protein S40293_06213 [Stachybotrys chartarum IBT 40293]|nr:hypothetical protein S40293_06213 [Stachybotrys chartarum IBT 40293]